MPNAAGKGCSRRNGTHGRSATSTPTHAVGTINSCAPMLQMSERAPLLKSPQVSSAPAESAMSASASVFTGFSASTAVSGTALSTCGPTSRPANR